MMLNEAKMPSLKDKILEKALEKAKDEPKKVKTIKKVETIGKKVKGRNKQIK